MAEIVATRVKQKWQVCVVCGETFDNVPHLFHCLDCDHHYPLADEECGNCHNDPVNVMPTVIIG